VNHNSISSARCSFPALPTPFPGKAAFRLGGSPVATPREEVHKLAKSLNILMAITILLSYYAWAFHELRQFDDDSQSRMLGTRPMVPRRLCFLCWRRSATGHFVVHFLILSCKASYLYFANSLSPLFHYSFCRYSDPACIPVAAIWQSIHKRVWRSTFCLTLLIRSHVCGVRILCWPITLNLHIS